jgi:hypothetical protein
MELSIGASRDAMSFEIISLFVWLVADGWC